MLGSMASKGGCGYACIRLFLISVLFPKSATACVFCASRVVVVSLNARMVSHTGLYIMYRMMRLRPHHVMSCQSLARYDENTLSLFVPRRDHPFRVLHLFLRKRFRAFIALLRYHFWLRTSPEIRRLWITPKDTHSLHDQE